VRLPQLEDLPALEGAAVLVRADLNVPLGTGPAGEVVVADDFRIRAALPTLRFLLDQGATVTVCSHLGRPKGRPDDRYRMAPVAERLQALLAAEGMGAADLHVLENLRFDPGEEANDADFVARLVAGQDCYVDDAFGAAHRAHASVVGPPALLPSAAGRLLAREVEVLSALRDAPARPFVAVLGGAKVSDKLGVLRALLERVDRVVVGGGMCFTFLAAAGHAIGGSLVEADMVETCAELLAEGERIVLPVDIVALGPAGTLGGSGGGGQDTAGRGAAAEGPGEGGSPRRGGSPEEGGSSGHGGNPEEGVATYGLDLPEGWRGLDIGPASAVRFAEIVSEAATVFWNGPMGVFEDPRFAAGTEAVARAVAAAPGFTVVGGGDSAAALERFGLASSVDHLSTGGGASLELLERGDLPGLEALQRWVGGA
jgi:phosphoglycerate kinase